MGVTYINPYRFGVAFSPLDLSPALWLDASDTSTITQSSGAVSQWNDKSGNGRNVTQATAAAQPGTGAVTQNGLNVLTFDGGDWLQASTASHWKFLHDGTDYLVASVVQFGTSSNPNASYALLSTFDTSFSNVGTFIAYDDRASIPRNDVMRQSVCNGSGTPSVLNNTADGFITPNAFNVLSLTANPDSGTASARSNFFTNGGSATSNNSQTTGTSSANPQFPITIGMVDNIFAPNRLWFLVGRVAEIVIVSGTNATEANRVALRDYLNAKWLVY